MEQSLRSEKGGKPVLPEHPSYPPSGPGKKEKSNGNGSLPQLERVCEKKERSIRTALSFLATTSRKKAPEYHVRRADPDDEGDRASIMRLWLDNLPHITRDICLKRFEWLYRENPAGPALTWVATEGNEGEVIGCASVMPRRFVIEGEPHLGGLAIDFAIDRRYRSYGAALRLQRAVSEQVWGSGIGFLLAFPNSAARGVFKRMGYREAGRNWNGARLIRSFGKLRRHLRPIPLAATVGAGVDLLLLIQNRVSLRAAPKGCQVELLDEADARWQQFWEGRSSSIRFGTVHDLEYLRWRHSQPAVHSRMFALFDEEGELRGYLSFTRQGDVLEVRDVQVSSERWFGPLLDRFWQEMYRAKALVINIGLVGTDTMIRRFQRAGFLTRSVEGWAGVLPGPTLERDLLEAIHGDAWYLGEADLDI